MVHTAPSLDDIDLIARVIHSEWPGASDWYEDGHRNIDVLRAMGRAVLDAIYDPGRLGLIPLSEVERLRAVERAARYLRNSDAWVGDTDGIEANLMMLDEALNEESIP